MSTVPLEKLIVLRDALLEDFWRRAYFYFWHVLYACVFDESDVGGTTE
jgi:hypothetical protein